MATKNAALRNKMAEDFGTLFDGGKLIIRDTTTVLVEFTLGATAFGSATAGEIEAAGLPISAVAGATGTADNAILESSTGTYQLTGLTVGTAAADVIINDTSVTDTQDAELIAFTWTESDGIA